MFLTKYSQWYEQIILRAKGRQIPVCYTELHHILPRSLGGADEPDNLVRLTYREHFLVHWLLTRMLSGGSLRKMQRALFAMTMNASGERIISGWQFEAAKRSVRDLELDPVVEAAWRERYCASLAAKEAQLMERARLRPLRELRNRSALKAEVHSAIANGVRDDLDRLGSKLIQAGKRKMYGRSSFDQKLPRAIRLQMASELKAEAALTGIQSMNRS